MQLITLENLFGFQVSQDTNLITIYKDNLPGLIPSADNKAEQLLVALLVKALNNFQGEITTQSGDLIEIGNGEHLSFDNSEQFELLKIIFWKPFFSRLNKFSDIYEIKQLVISRFEISGNEYEN